MAKFITLHACYDRVSIRVDRIVSVREADKHTIVFMEEDPGPWNVDETYDQVMAKIKEASDGEC